MFPGESDELEKRASDFRVNPSSFPRCKIDFSICARNSSHVTTFRNDYDVINCVKISYISRSDKEREREREGEKKRKKVCVRERERPTSVLRYLHRLPVLSYAEQDPWTRRINDTLRHLVHNPCRERRHIS